MFSHGEPSPALPAFHRRGGPIPLRAIWLELAAALSEGCNRAEPVQEVPGARLESRPSSFSHAA